MASAGNHLYKQGIINMLSGNIDITGTFTAALINGTYAQQADVGDSLNTSSFYDTTMGTNDGGTGGTQIGNQVDLTVVTASDGLGIGVAFDAADTVFTSVGGSGEVVKGIVVFQSGTQGSTDYLLSYWDNDGSAISITTNGGDITVQWSAGGLFMISGGTS